MMRTRTAILATFVAAGLMVGACSTDSSNTPDTKPFVECMRAHGLPDFPEVTVSSEGLVNFNIDGERVDVRSEKYGAAVKECGPLLPDGSRLPDAPEAPTAP